MADTDTVTDTTTAAATQGRTSAFLVVQSDSEANIDKAKGADVWASTEGATDAFVSAYCKYDDVYLCFSAFVRPRDEQTFSGIARMGGLPVIFLEVEFWPTHEIPFGNGFKIEWIAKDARAPFVISPTTSARDIIYQNADMIGKDIAHIPVQQLVVGANSSQLLHGLNEHLGNLPNYAPLQASTVVADNPRVNTLTSYYRVIKKPAPRRIVRPTHIITKKT